MPSGCSPFVELIVPESGCRPLIVYARHEVSVTRKLKWNSDNVGPEGDYHSLASLIAPNTGCARSCLLSRQAISAPCVSPEKPSSEVVPKGSSTAAALSEELQKGRHLVWRCSCQLPQLHCGALSQMAPSRRCRLRKPSIRILEMVRDLEPVTSCNAIARCPTPHRSPRHPFDDVIKRSKQDPNVRRIQRLWTHRHGHPPALLVGR